MLVLTRKIGESILIGDDIAVSVMGLIKGRVRIGINAPEDVKILREEIQNQHPRLSTDSVEKPVQISYKARVKPWKRP